MHVYCDLFDVLDFTERNEDLSIVEAPTLLFVKASGIHEISYIFCLCMFSLIYLSMHVLDSIAMLKQLPPLY